MSQTPAEPPYAWVAVWACFVALVIGLSGLVYFVAGAGGGLSLLATVAAWRPVARPAQRPVLR